MIVKSLAFSMAASLFVSASAMAQTAPPAPPPAAPSTTPETTQPVAEAAPPTKVEKVAAKTETHCRSVPRLDSPTMRKVICN